MKYETVTWRNGRIIMLDQRKLPSEEVYVECNRPEEVAEAIRNMTIRGAPAIGVAAAMGIALVQEGIRKDLRYDGRDTSDCSQPLLGRPEDERGCAQARRKGIG
jgi:methylthioribose-1-phosphate isomerase